MFTNWNLKSRENLKTMIRLRRNTNTLIRKKLLKNVFPKCFIYIVCKSLL